MLPTNWWEKAINSKRLKHFTSEKHVENVIMVSAEKNRANYFGFYTWPITMQWVTLFVLSTLTHWIAIYLVDSNIVNGLNPGPGCSKPD